MLRKDDRGIQCEIEYDDAAQNYEAIFEDGFKGTDGTAFCYLYEVTVEDPLTITQIEGPYTA